MVKRALILILIVAGWRLVNLEATPLFGDEAVYCLAGDAVAHKGVVDTWQVMVTGKKFAPLLSLIQGLGFATLPGIAPIFWCRSVSVIASAATAVVLFELTQSWATLVFWLFNPFNFFNDRTSLQEPLLNLFIVMTIKSPLWLVGAFLTKLSTLMLVPGLMIWTIWRKNVIATVTLGLTTIAFWWWATHFTQLWDIFGYHAYADWSVTGLVSRAATNLRLTVSWYQQYLGWGFGVLTILGLWQSWKSRQWQWLIILISTLTGYILLADSYFPRLLLVTLPFWAILAGYAAKLKWGWLVLALMLVGWIKNDLNLVWRPESAKIAKEDYFQFYQDWTSGQKVKQAILDWENQPELKQIKVSKDTAALWQVYKLQLAPARQIEIVIEE